ncbi:hypothetical protein FHS47_002967 [Lutibacter sp. SG786]|nr:hypothetical protein [Luteibacter sp. SG786]
MIEIETRRVDFSFRCLADGRGSSSPGVFMCGALSF